MDYHHPPQINHSGSIIPYLIAISKQGFTHWLVFWSTYYVSPSLMSSTIVVLDGTHWKNFGMKEPRDCKQFLASLNLTNKGGARLSTDDYPYLQYLILLNVQYYWHIDITSIWFISYTSDCTNQHIYIYICSENICMYIHLCMDIYNYISFFNIFNTL